jgi:hypothetical protein
VEHCHVRMLHGAVEDHGVVQVALEQPVHVRACVAPPPRAKLEIMFRHPQGDVGIRGVLHRLRVVGVDVVRPLAVRATRRGREGPLVKRDHHRAPPHLARAERRDGHAVPISYESSLFMMMRCSGSSQSWSNAVGRAHVAIVMYW